MVAASSPASSRPRADPTALVVVGVAYDGWEAESLLAPLSVIHRASNVAERSGKSTRARVLVAAEKKRACLSPQGCAIVPDATWSEVEKADIILVPGGFSAIIESSNPTLLDFLRRVSKNAKLVASVSSGAAILAKAGLLDKKSATTSKASFPTLAPNHPKTNWVPRARFIADDRLVTGAGVASAVDVAFEIVRTIWGSQIERSVASLVGGGGWRPANWDEDEFGRGVVKAGPIYTYITSAILEFTAPYLLPSVLGEVRRKAGKRTVYVIVVEGWTDSLSLGRGVECWGAPACVSDITFQFVHIFPPSVLATPPMSPILARTASDIVLECDVQIPRGIPASSCLPYAPSPHDILFVPEFLLPPPQHSGEARDAERDLRTSIRPLADAAGIVVACGSDAAAAAGAPREEIAMAQAAGWSRRGKWVVCGSAISVAGAALDVIEGIFGERCRKQVVEFGEVREGVAAVRGGVRRE